MGCLHLLQHTHIGSEMRAHVGSNDYTCICKPCASELAGLDYVPNSTQAHRAAPIHVLHVSVSGQRLWPVASVRADNDDDGSRRASHRITRCDQFGRKWAYAYILRCILYGIYYIRLFCIQIGTAAARPHTNHLTEHRHKHNLCVILG